MTANINSHRACPECDLVMAFAIWNIYGSICKKKEKRTDKKQTQEWKKISINPDVKSRWQQITFFIQKCMSINNVHTNGWEDVSNMYAYTYIYLMKQQSSPSGFKDMYLCVEANLRLCLPSTLMVQRNTVKLISLTYKSTN